MDRRANVLTPGSLLAPPSRRKWQWLRGGRSPVTVARPSRILTGFLASPKLTGRHASATRRRARAPYVGATVRRHVGSPEHSAAAYAAGFDATRASERAADPRGWRLEDGAIEALREVIAGRRDIRKFRPDEVPDDVVTSASPRPTALRPVGLMQPWRFIVVRSPAGARRDAAARPARAPAPGRPVRCARPAVPRPEDRGDRRGPGRDRRLLRSRRRGRRGARPRHDPRDRRVLDGLRHPEPLAHGPRRGAWDRLGELLPTGRSAGTPADSGAGDADGLPLRRLAR